MKRVLFIAYLFPPIANSGTRRSLCFANRLPDCGWTPVVLTACTTPPQFCDPSLLDEVRPGLQVERVELGARKVARIAARVIPGRDLRERVEGAMAWRLERLCHAPDEIVSWLPWVIVRGIRLHRIDRFDAIYASGWPWTSFIAARLISWFTGCPYVLDYRDTWKPSGTHAWEVQTRAQRWFGASLERFAAARAAAVVTTTPTLVEVVKADSGSTDVRCITNGFEPEDFQLSNAQLSDSGADGRSIVISYTGVWRPGYGLEDLYKAIAVIKAGNPQLAQRLRVHAAGFKPGHAKEFGIEDLVSEAGFVPHSVAVEMMLGSDILYLPVPLGFYARASLPGKLFEYLGSGRPILAVAPIDSEVARVLKNTGGAHRVDPGNVDALAQLLRGVLESTVTFTTFEAMRPSEVEKYSRASTTQQLACVLDEVVRRSARGNTHNV